MDQALQALQDAIQSLHDAMGLTPDPQLTAGIGQCLAKLTQIQHQMMQSGPSQGGPGPQPGPGGDPADPRAALLAQLGGP